MNLEQWVQNNRDDMNPEKPDHLKKFHFLWESPQPVKKNVQTKHAPATNLIECRSLELEGRHHSVIWYVFQNFTQPGLFFDPVV